MKVATNIQENAEDIYAGAKQINEERTAEEVTVYAESSEEASTGDAE
jgi:hypothetical protein